MASKIKNVHTYIVHQNGAKGQGTIIGRYRVGAKNPEDACRILREKLGKFIQCRVYYEEKNENNFLPYGQVLREC